MSISVKHLKKKISSKFEVSTSFHFGLRGRNGTDRLTLAPFHIMAPCREGCIRNSCFLLLLILLLLPLLLLLLIIIIIIILIIIIIIINITVIDFNM